MDRLREGLIRPATPEVTLDATATAAPVGAAEAARAVAPTAAQVVPPALQPAANTAPLPASTQALVGAELTEWRQLAAVSPEVATTLASDLHFADLTAKRPVHIAVESQSGSYAVYAVETGSSQSRLTFTQRLDGAYLQGFVQGWNPFAARFADIRTRAAQRLSDDEFTTFVYGYLLGKLAQNPASYRARIQEASKLQQEVDRMKEARVRSPYHIFRLFNSHHAPSAEELALRARIRQLQSPLYEMGPSGRFELSEAARFAFYGKTGIAGHGLHSPGLVEDPIVLLASLGASGLLGGLSRAGLTIRQMVSREGARRIALGSGISVSWDLVDQTLRIAGGIQETFNYSETLVSSLFGAGGGVMLSVRPGLGSALSAVGLGSSLEALGQDQTVLGAYRAITSLFGPAVFRRLVAGLRTPRVPASRMVAPDGSKCFAAGTPLLTSSGSKRIEEVRKGDFVLARPENAPEGPLDSKEVEEVFVRTGVVWEVRIGGRVIRTTGEHPFYVLGKGWVNAAYLECGDRCVSHDGQRMMVEGVTETSSVETVYNLRVADYHTYYVGCQQWGFSVWAHNADCHVEAYLRSIGITDEATIQRVVAARENPGRVAAELLADPSIRSGNAANLRAVRDRVVRMAEIRQQPLTGFNRSQQQRLASKLDDIEHVRNGHPAPSGNWHSRDGIPFNNREGLLPPSTKGYTEYRVLGSDGRPSGARIVINEDNGRVFYSQHYGDDGSGFTEVINFPNRFR